MAEEFHFEVVDARQPPEEIQESLRSKIQPILKNGQQMLAQTTVPESTADRS